MVEWQPLLGEPYHTPDHCSLRGNRPALTTFAVKARDSPIFSRWSIAPKGCGADPDPSPDPTLAIAAFDIEATREKRDAAGTREAALIRKTHV